MFKSALLQQVRLAYYLKQSTEEDIPKDSFLKGLDRLNDHLKKEGEHLTFLCVGGGALMLAYNFREKTQDLDGIPLPSSEDRIDLIQRLARQVAKELHLPPDWINAQVKNIMKGQGWSKSNFVSSPRVPDWSNLKLLFAKPAYLLSMKCQALRTGKRDFGDISKLCKMLNIKSYEQLLAVIEEYGVDSGHIGNDEVGYLKIAIAWAFPNQTPYENLRQNLLRVRSS